MNGNIVYSIIVLYCLYVTIHGLRWSRSGVPFTYKTLHLKSASANINVDVSYSTQVTIVRDLQLWNYSVIVSCFIAGYNNMSEIVYSFCKNEDPCIKYKDRESLLPFKEFNLEGNIETTFADKRGLRIHLKVPNKYSDISGHYFCKVDNDKISVQSNYIDMRDTFFWDRKIFTKVESSYKTDIQTVTMKSLPSVINCSDGNSVLNTLLPVWARMQFHSVVMWSVCPVLKNFNQLSADDKMSTEKCLSLNENKCVNQTNERICPRDLGKMAGWKYYITERGDLIFSDLPLENTNTGDTYLLMCYSKDSYGDLQSISYFLNKKNDAYVESGVATDGSQRVFTQTLKANAPLVQDVVLYARQTSSDRALEPVAIYALFQSSSDVTFQWKFNSVNLNANNILSVTKWMVVFEKEITSDQAGNYTLEVVDKADKLTMAINVKVLGVPILDNGQCMPVILYVWDGESANFSCVFKYRPTNIKVLINSQEIQLNNTLDTSQAQLKSAYTYLSELAFSVTPAEYIETESVLMAYKVFKLHKTPGQSQYQDHSVTFQASNKFGYSLKSTSIYVVPHLKTIVNYFPERDSCLNNCSSSQLHRFKCNVRVEEYLQKELIVDHYWTVNGYRFNDLKDDRSNVYDRYFKMDPKTKELTLAPIKSSDAFDTLIKDLLKDALLECHVNLHPIYSEDSSFVYISSSDKELGSRMKAKVTMDFVTISTSSYLWIVLLILGIVVVIVVAVLIFVCCRNKNKGKESRLQVKYDLTHGSVEEIAKSERVQNT